METRFSAIRKTIAYNATGRNYHSRFHAAQLSPASTMCLKDAEMRRHLTHKSVHLILEDRERMTAVEARCVPGGTVVGGLGLQ